MNRFSGMLRRASMAANRLRTDVSPKPSSSSSLMPRLRLRQREDVGRLLDPAVARRTARSACRRGPRCRRRARDTKCFRRSTACAGQIRPPVQRRTTSSLPVRRIDLAHRMAAADGTDLREIRRAWRPSGRFSGTTPSTCGITSPARWTSTVSPMRTSLRAISSSLCSVALVHDDAADRDRLQPRHRRQRAGAADLDVDAVQDGGRLLGREFVRHRPARAARDEAEPLLQVEPVDLVDDAVDVVAERGAARLDLAVEREHLLDRMASASSAD